MQYRFAANFGTLSTFHLFICYPLFTVVRHFYSIASFLYGQLVLVYLQSVSSWKPKVLCVQEVLTKFYVVGNCTKWVTYFLDIQ